ncbi:MAG TPA: nitroreductase family protein [Burkholderiales bacterium]|nr:nitroreductase family protein [Burkholderiales bacterium]
MCLFSGEEPKTVFDIIRTRRSVRTYSADRLERGTIMTLLEAAVLAPTAMHEEPWEFVVIQDGKMLKRISDLAKPLFIQSLHHSPDAFKDPEFDIFHGAGTLIVICTKPSGPFVEADCWLAAENLMLAACGSGLGSCVIGSSIAAISEMRKDLGIPPDFEVVAPIAVGVPAGEIGSSSRKEPSVLAWL